MPSKWLATIRRAGPPMCSLSFLNERAAKVKGRPCRGKCTAGQPIDQPRIPCPSHDRPAVDRGAAIAFSENGGALLHASSPCIARRSNGFSLLHTVLRMEHASRVT